MHVQFYTIQRKVLYVRWYVFPIVRSLVELCILLPSVFVQWGSSYGMLCVPFNVQLHLIWCLVPIKHCLFSLSMVSIEVIKMSWKSMTTFCYKKTCEIHTLTKRVRIFFLVYFHRSIPFFKTKNVISYSEQYCQPSFNWPLTLLILNQILTEKAWILLKQHQL